ncbi:MAG: hypothetical protein KAG56_08450 [Sulfurovaceae bacterium]|nr:hypothetical protein [Sulfurovaceae bacterium]
MTYYLIQLFNNMISIHECTESQQSALKHMGEESQKFQYEAFWVWWKKKVEYQGEPATFIIITDKDTFDVPQDILIADVKSIDSLNNPFLHNIPTDYNLISKPDNIVLNSTLQEKTKTKVKKIPSNNNSLEDYFVKETTRLRS